MSEQIIRIERTEAPFTFLAKNEAGNEILMDTTANGGLGKGFGPMQLLLAAIGGCSGIDIVLILQKQKQEIKSFRMEVKGNREKDGDVSLWKNIHVCYYFSGQVDLEKAQRAADLSMEKYCSVSKTLSPTAQISWEVILEN